MRLEDSALGKGQSIVETEHKTGQERKREREREKERERETGRLKCHLLNVNKTSVFMMSNTNGGLKLYGFKQN